MKRQINSKTLSTRGFECLYPFENHFATINGHKLHYLDQGKGNPVLMVHGNPTWSFYFRNLVMDLSPDHRVIVPDHIGCGFSDKPPADSYDYTLEQRVADLDTLMGHLDIGQRIDLIVHDWGGMIGLAWALDHPERINRIVVTNTSGFFLPLEKRFPLRLWMIKYLKWFAVPAVLGLNLFSRSALFMAPAMPLTREARCGLTAPYNSWKNRIATLAFVQDIPLTPQDRSYNLVARVDQNLNRLDPDQLLILWGEKDFVFDRAFLNQWKQRFPKAQCHVFPDAGHYLFEDKPRETSRIIQDFLKP
ncbi:MAG: alpha/beta fold hydrolase [Pseudomonadota bacterium]